ncbi:tRNA lysidine(34) synthetase TilS [Thermodesulfovibrionales bacterium]|nr:tRNA lysidine(34) synthetase TilS [Thermodesulfovibrionales bacterium]
MPCFDRKDRESQFTMTTMETIRKVKDTIEKYSMLFQGDRLLVGLSGGPDSVCLLTILSKLKSEFNIAIFAAYIDHGLRPEETPYEIDFCRKLCKALDIPVIIKSIDVKSHARERGLNRQEAARELRYEAFDEIASETNAGKIALGHNADDQAETILMRLFRGAGPLGLSGIPPVRRQIVRPLIETERSEIDRFLKSEGIGFVTDSSNRSDKYQRNKIRHLIIPAIKEMNSDFIRTVSRAADILRDEEKYFETIITKRLMTLVSRKSDLFVELFLSPLEAMDTVILRRVLRRVIDETNGLHGISFINIEEIVALVKSGKSGDRIYLPKGIRAIKKYSTIIITFEEPARLRTCVLHRHGETILKESSMVIQSTTVASAEIRDYGDGKEMAVIDSDKAYFPLLIRRRLPGDCFYPFGFGRKKKIQDYFVDEKIPRDERDIIPLLTCDNNIVWVVGYRLDERYKVDKNTKNALELKIRPLKI